MGMPSITKRDAPRPKLRVTFRSSTPVLAHDAQTILDKVDGDDEESADPVEFDDGFRCPAFDRVTADNELDPSRFTVALALGDFAREDDGFEIKDREFVIVKFFRSME
jgi:hypothetical protein